MTAIEMMEAAFNKKLDLILKDNEPVRNFVLNHPKRQLCLKNLSEQIFQIELSDNIKLDKKKIEDIGEQFALTFSKVALMDAEKKAVSDLENRRLRHDEEEWEAMDEIAEEIDKSTGL